MAKKLANRGNKPGFQIAAPREKLKPIDLEKQRMESPDEGVSISLKYFRKDTECFSDWQPAELKKFSAAIDKVKQLSAGPLQGYKPLCAPHKRDPAEARFARPPALSEDLSFFEIKVDPHNAARIHGVFVGSIFYLVWLDRLHAVYPE